MKNSLWEKQFIILNVVCRRCGALTDVCFEDMTDSLRRQLGEDFLFYDLKVYYLCPDCRRRERGQA